MHISEAGGRTVASDIETAFGSVDLAILDAARLTASVMETKQTAVVPPAKFQRVVDSLSSSLVKIIEGRKDMVAAHRSLTVLKDESNLEVLDFGCFSVDEGIAASNGLKIEA